MVGAFRGARGALVEARPHPLYRVPVYNCRSEVGRSRDVPHSSRVPSLDWSSWLRQIGTAVDPNRAIAVRQLTTSYSRVSGPAGVAAARPANAVAEQAAVGRITAARGRNRERHQGYHQRRQRNGGGRHGREMVYRSRGFRNSLKAGQA